MYLLKQTEEPPPSKPNWISAGLNAGGRQLQTPEQHSGSLNNGGESGAFVTYTCTQTVRLSYNPCSFEV